MTTVNPDWTSLPGSSDYQRAILEGYLSAYVEPHARCACGHTMKAHYTGESTACTHPKCACPRYIERTTIRWSIWFHGTLLGEGFTDDRREAERQAGYEADRIDQRIRDMVRGMDVRNRGSV